MSELELFIARTASLRAKLCKAEIAAERRKQACEKKAADWWKKRKEGK